MDNLDNILKLASNLPIIGGGGPEKPELQIRFGADVKAGLVAMGFNREVGNVGFPGQDAAIVACRILNQLDNETMREVGEDLVKRANDRDDREKVHVPNFDVTKTR